MAAVPAATTSNAWNFSWRCAGAASAIRRCCAPWTKCRANILSPRAQIESAYADQALPIACGQTISQPFVVAYMTEQLEVEPAAPGARNRDRLRLSGGDPVAAGARGGEHRALSDACGSRARAAQDAGLCEHHGSRRRRHGRRARIWRLSIASWSRPPPKNVPEALTAQLAEGGKMVLPVGPRHDAQYIVKLTQAKRRRINPRKSDCGAICAAFAGPSARTVTAEDT